MTQQVQETRQCSACGSGDTYYFVREHRFQWHTHPVTKKWLCHTCYCRLISNPKQLQFQDRRVYLKESPRCGVCCWCRAIVGQVDAVRQRLVRKMDIHHENYHPEDPLRDALEICRSCHGEVDGYYYGDE